jgi:hypothetical protein
VLLVVGGLLSVIGIGFTGRALFWMILNGPSVAHDARLETVKIGLKLAAWVLIAAAAYTGWRRDAVPATWMLITIPVICFFLVLAQRYGAQLY